ncbi:DUF6454 family protein [Marinivivus vitaminiproducens]|uniref:DUF6454 family protein n=1 Tax=Marinivivus vitaminiproducens TaxID=3035935 RepID=UPI0027A355A5|nr:DUF6454 family protein [Geminicoccaceae bacterium SCSIO 64248]
MNRLIALALGAACVVAAPAVADELEARIERLTRGSAWTLVESPTLGFDTFHPQGFARVGDTLFMASVEITQPTTRFDAPQDGYDRDTGKGVGHLFKLDANGAVTGRITLGEGAIYHPGGIAYDGRWLWVPVAEYRPNSHAIVYRVDPETLEAVEVFRVADHIGGLVHDPANGTLHGVSWGSRRLYTWHLDENLAVTDAGTAPEDVRTPNPAHYIDYQDCEGLGAGKAVCTGLTEYRQTEDGEPFALGGIEIVDLASGHPTFQVPVPLWTDEGLAMTRNPVLIEATEDGLRLTAAPEDGETRLFVYETALD